MVELTEKKTDEIKKEADALKCPVRRSLYYIDEFLKGPMCGKCFPCEMGSYEARVRLEGLVAGRGSEADLPALKRIADVMTEASRCKKGKDTAKFLLEWLASDVFAEHVRGACPDRDCMGLMEYRVIPEKCTICGLCKEVCKDNAIIGEKKSAYKSGYLPYEIRQKRCTKCGECIKVCPSGAIELVEIKKTEKIKV